MPGITSKQINTSTNFFKLAILICTCALLTGCMSVKQYVDPTLPKVNYSDLKPVTTQQPVQLFFEFQTNGTTNAKGTEALRPMIVDELRKSALFSSVVITPETADRKLYITINNFAVTKDAASKGFTTGLTFGLAGTMVTDGYLMTASFTTPGQPEFKHTYQHALHTTVGNADGPPGLTPAPKGEAIKQITEGLTLNMLKDLSNSGDL